MSEEDKIQLLHNYKKLEEKFPNYLLPHYNINMKYEDILYNYNICYDFLDKKLTIYIPTSIGHVHTFGISIKYFEKLDNLELDKEYIITIRHVVDINILEIIRYLLTSDNILIEDTFKSNIISNFKLTFDQFIDVMKLLNCINSNKILTALVRYVANEFKINSQEIINKYNENKWKSYKLTVK